VTLRNASTSSTLYSVYGTEISRGAVPLRLVGVWLGTKHASVFEQPPKLSDSQVGSLLSSQALVNLEARFGINYVGGAPIAYERGHPC